MKTPALIQSENLIFFENNKSCILSASYVMSDHPCSYLLYQ